MRRIALMLLPVAALCCASGCQEPQQEEDLQQAGVQTAGMETDYFVTDPAGGAADDAYTAYPAAGSGDETYTTFPATPADQAEAVSTGSGTHIVAKGDTLFSLARHYYGDQRRWKDIYEANRSRISSPDRICVGQELVLP